MKKALFFHARLSGGSNVDTNASIDSVYGRKQFAEQMSTLTWSWLMESADEIYVGLNGDLEDRKFVRSLLPPKCKLLFHGPDKESLIPTMGALQDWLPEHEDWAVCFLHTKGITHPNDQFHQAWLGCMERVVVWGWRKCVADLQTGIDTVGAHWISPEKYPAAFYPHHETKTPYWGGVFWWARADFLMKLPALKRTIERRHDWYGPELWIGSGPLPSVRDYANHWPSPASCNEIVRVNWPARSRT